MFHGDISDVIYCSMRRCLCFPLYRHWELVQAVLKDTKIIFKLGRSYHAALVVSLPILCTSNFNKFRCSEVSHLTGRRKVLQCLLDIHQLLNSSEPYYILNNLYITDYCVWLQHSSPQTLHSLAQELSQV